MQSSYYTQPAQQVTQVPLSQMVELHISCRNLKNLDILTKSDPQIHFYTLDEHTKQWTLFGKTEIVKDNLNPNFNTYFTMAFQFEKHQHLRFEVIDVDPCGTSEFIGYMQTKLGVIMGKRSQTYETELKNDQTKGKRGIITIKGNPIRDCNANVNYQIKCNNIANVRSGLFGLCVSNANSSLPVKYELSRQVAGSDHFAKVYESPSTWTRSPIWEPMRISLSKLANGDKDLPFKVKLIVEGKEIGHIITTANQVTEQRVFEVQKPTGGAGKGTIEFVDFKVIEAPSFLEYLTAGWQINMAVAIDFTASNGNPNKQNSLHYFFSKFNQYEQAIQQVGSILEPYSYHRQYPTFGFGAKPPGLNQISHCFPLNGNEYSPSIQGVDGILQYYRHQLPNIRFAGPTYFSPVLEAFKTYSSQVNQQGQQVYQILLILTDGTIHDMEIVKKLIVETSHLPTSIIIVGLGDDDFEMMEELDSDEQLLKDDRGNQCVRDMVQFVKFNEAIRNGNLAEEVLREIPEQMCLHMENIGFQV